MKIVSKDDNGNVLVEWDNLRHPRTIGERIPVRMLIPKDDILIAQKINNVIEKMMKKSAQKTALLIQEPDDRPIAISFPPLL